MNDSETKQNTESKSPAYIAYHVRGKEGAKGFFTRIGAAWISKDGKGLNLQIEAMPINGRIVLRPANETKE